MRFLGSIITDIKDFLRTNRTLFNYSIEILSAIGALGFGIVTIFYADKTSSIAFSVIFFIFALVSIKLTVLSKRVQIEHSGLEVEDDRHAAFHRVSKYISRARDPIYVYGIGVFGYSSSVGRYLDSILVFLNPSPTIRIIAY